MKKFVLSTLILASSFSFTTQGALLVKKEVAIHQSGSMSNDGADVLTASAPTTSENSPRFTHKFHKQHRRNLGELPKGVYIAMCILPLGWLAIAINSNFTENEWIFALLWYVLLYLPGVYYSLRQMRRFYGR